MHLRIGVDGGATKTECILVDAQGEVVATHAVGGSNPSIVGAAAAEQTVAEALAALSAQTSAPIVATLLCMAGAPEFWKKFAASRQDLGRVTATTDAAPTLELAAPHGPGIVLHAGTGSFVAGRTTDDLTQVHYAGGLGWRFGDEGSGFDLGRRAIARGLLELQGWLPPSPIGAMLQAFTGAKDANAATAFFYRDDKSSPSPATMAPAFLGLLAKEDPVAQEIFDASTDGLLALAARVASVLFPGVNPQSLEVGVSGPILTHGAALPRLRARSAFNLHPVEGRPIEGVRRLVARL